MRRFTTLLSATLVMATAVGVPGRAQAPAANVEPAFDVVSIKPMTSTDSMMMVRTEPGGRFVASNVPVRELIRIAYQVMDSQIVDAPAWAQSERFNVQATTATELPVIMPFGPATPVHTMLQGVLRDRFRLRLRRDRRELPIFGLSLARQDGRPGPALSRSVLDCERETARSRATATGPGCDVRLMPGKLAMRGSSIPQLARVLSGMVGRVVVDDTGLSGTFDIAVDYQGPQPPPVDPQSASLPTGPSLFTALQEQLGLKLERRNGPADVLVVEALDRPTPD